MDQGSSTLEKHLQAMTRKIVKGQTYICWGENALEVLPADRVV